MHIDIAPPVPEDELRMIRAAMQRHTETHVPWEADQELNVVARDDVGRIIGACLGKTANGWMYLGLLWVDDSCRGQDIGTKLMRAAEEEGRRRGCYAAHLNTFSYEARPFYEKLGYEVFGTVDDFPGGHRRFFLTKRLDG
jgi:GNAT superfamily N-acetyltransferase